jgi:hypothetical protein
MNDLFTPIFNNNEFEVTLNYPLWITENPYKLKDEVKRGLLEMVDTYDKLSLAYSGGSDSGFILCCLCDLIEQGKLKKDTIDIFMGVFYTKTFPYSDTCGLQAGLFRAIRFANSLGIDPRLVEIEFDNLNVYNEIKDQQFKWAEIYNSILRKDATYAAALQTYVCSMQDSTVIRGGVLGLTGYLSQGFNNTAGLLVGPEQIKHYHSDCDEVQMFLWDNKIFSCFFSPFSMKKRDIDNAGWALKTETKRIRDPRVEMYNEQNPLSVKKMNKYLGKWMLYLQCYPEMSQIFGKIHTLIRHRANTALGHALATPEYSRPADGYFFDEMNPQLIEKYGHRRATLKLQNGETFSPKSHLTNYKDFF